MNGSLWMVPTVLEATGVLLVGWAGSGLLLIGWRQPSILVPAQAGLPSREVLLHGLAHLRRKDL